MKIFKWPWPLTFIWPWPWVWPWRFEEIRFFQFFSFSLKSRDANTWRRTSKRTSHTNALFYKEHFATNQKSLSLPVQMLWPIMWFSMTFLKSRDVKRWRRTSKSRVSCRSGVYKERFASNQKSLPLPVEKLSANYLIFTKVVTLTLPFIRFSKNWIPIVLGLEDIFCQKIRTIGPAVWPVHRERTDRQTDTHTDTQTAVTNILFENRRFRKVTNRQTGVNT